jgi:integrase
MKSSNKPAAETPLEDDDVTTVVIREPDLAEVFNLFRRLGSRYPLERQVLFRLMADTGARISEVLSLTPGMFSWVNGKLSEDLTIPAEIRKGRSPLPCKVLLSKDTVLAVQQLVNQRMLEVRERIRRENLLKALNREPVPFVTEEMCRERLAVSALFPYRGPDEKLKDVKCLARSTAHRYIVDLLTRVLGPERAQYLRPHSTRHTKATAMHEAGATLRDIQIVLGHKQLETTARYVHSSEQRLAEVQRKVYRDREAFRRNYHPEEKWRKTEAVVVQAEFDGMSGSSDNVVLPPEAHAPATAAAIKRRRLTKRCKPQRPRKRPKREYNC